VGGHQPQRSPSRNDVRPPRHRQAAIHLRRADITGRCSSEASVVSPPRRSMAWNWARLDRRTAAEARGRRGCAERLARHRVGDGQADEHPEDRNQARHRLPAPSCAEPWTERRVSVSPGSSIGLSGSLVPAFEGSSSVPVQTASAARSRSSLIPSFAPPPASAIPGRLSVQPWCRAMTRHRSSNTGLPELPFSVGDR
jgi:hypothetical protein